MYLFQSAPLTEARGDLWRRGDRRDFRGVSIRSPHRSKGRLCYCHRAVHVFRVSIRSPHRSKGRQRLKRTRPRRAKFQSAPLTEARGDPELAAVAVLVLVSIRSPHRSKGRPLRRGADWRRSQRVSIRSPHRSKGRPSLAYSLECPAMSGFNPLPSPKQGETQPRGRLVARLPAVELFQSAPLTEARGDQEKRGIFHTSYLGVSIRSPHRSKGRIKLRIIDAAPVCFISAPLTRGHRTASRHP